MAILKVISLNIGNATALAGLLAVLSLEKPQIMMLQEITLSSLVSNFLLQWQSLATKQRLI